MKSYEPVTSHPLVKAILAAFPGATLHMSDPTQTEIEGMFAGANQGGAFLDQLGKTDLAALSPDEWMSFIEAVVTGFQDKVANLSAPYADDPPF